MSLMKKAILLILFSSVLCLSCTNNDDAGIEEVRLRINSYTVDCVGVLIGKCLLIQEGDKIGTEDWEYFYFENSIDGFTFEPDFIYEILVQKTQIADPPADGSSIRYTLVQIISKTKV
ncbi:MAG: DUF4377 domain-containing protein [Maribacter sp.]|uniref:DUF4377 domain-containing protein n=1 Tax=Maribacter sp. TaxID=1897614 RepID=UPI0032968E5B